MRLIEVRAAVAADLAAVRAMPRIDVEGIYLRLAALAEQAGKLVIFELPQQQAQPSRPRPRAGGSGCTEATRRPCPNCPITLLSGGGMCRCRR